MPAGVPNIMPVANVATRDAALSRVSDTAFLQHVRGGRAIRILISDILGRSSPPPSTAEVREILQILREEQYKQRVETLRCRNCNRVVFGPVRSATGEVKWDWKMGADCQCGNGA
jgi:hypothetical protein